MRFIRGALCAAVLLISPALRAQTVTLLPGDPSIDGTKVKPGRSAYSLTVSASGSTKDLGTMSTEVAKVSSAGVDGWSIAHTMTSDGGNTLDTTVVVMKTIAPVSLRGVTPAGTISLDYAGVKITGEHRDPEGSAQALVQTLSEPAFDPNALEQLLQSLPLRDGYDIRVPMYTNESGMRWFNITATSGSASKTPVWNVLIKTPDGSYRYELDKADQSVVGYVFDDGNKMKITMKRLSH